MNIPNEHQAMSVRKASDGSTETGPLARRSPGASGEEQAEHEVLEKQAIQSERITDPGV
jgi:hypothetical protein